MITAYFVEHFWGEKNNGFDVLYHNMKHGQISTKELSEFIRERATIEEAYARSMTKLAKSASNFSQLGTFAPVWDVFKTSTEKLASCHLELVRKLQELIKEVQKYADDQAKAHKKTKEEVATTLEAVQNIQTISQALQKSKENYNAKTVEQERLRKEGAAPRDVEKAGVKAKKATESYKSYVDKYASAKSEFEQKMAETAQKFQDIEEKHILHMKEIIQSYSQSIEETHMQIGEVHKEFVNNMENTTVESLILKLAESKGTGKERPGPVEFEECNTAIATEGAKPRKRKAFAIPGRRKDKDTDSTESTEAESVKTSNGAPPGYYGTIDFQNANVPQVDEEGFCIRPEANENDAKENSFYSSSDSDDEDEPRKFHVEIKPVQPNNGNHQARSIDELKASIGNITLSPPASGQLKRNTSRLSGLYSQASLDWQASGDELLRSRQQSSYNDRLVNNDLLSLDPFAPPTQGSSSSVSSSAEIASLFQSNFLPSLQTKELEVCATSEKAEVLVHQEGSSFPASSTELPWNLVGEPLLGLKPRPRAESAPPTRSDGTEHAGTATAAAAVAKPAQETSVDLFSSISWSQSQWIAFNDEFVPCKRPNASPRDLLQRPLSMPPAKAFRFFSDDPNDPYNRVACRAGLFAERSPSPSRLSPAAAGDSAKAAASQAHNAASLQGRPTTPLAVGTIVPPPRPSSRPKLPAGKLAGINEIVRPFSPSKTSNASPPPAAPLARAESSSSLSSTASLSAGNTPTVDEDAFVGKLPAFEKRSETPAGTSRGPSPVTLGSQDSLPIAVAFTESVNAYFKGADPTKCIVKITGDMTLSFPSGIIKIFTSNPSPAVLSFRLNNCSKLEQILPNQQILYSDPSQSDSSTKDFWMNMQALTAYLRKALEQNPAASYYNVDILKYQVSSNGIQSTPLNLAVYWKCTPTTTDLRVDYRYNPESMVAPGPLANVQVLVPVDGGVTNMQSLPVAIWNAEQNKSLWKLSDVSEKSENEGAGSLRAKFELSDGPSNPATIAVQFLSEGGTLSGVDLELVGTGYRLSLVKKRFATGRYMADC
ncbi:F-BAR domain only protein 2 isoform X3 [Anguilla anguilla]|uniref:F-BAR domain only protein 2 isoform X3 n=1 Tax=Anguilla anguilla TaxID=7936 RepID=UPI0015AA756E|nr:F-BAR domain only protein 2 isoform X3 [Anguilla anguilla]